MRCVLAVVLVAAVSGCHPPRSLPPSEPRAGEEMTLSGGGAYLFRDGEKAADYAALMRSDRGAGSAYLNAMNGMAEDFRKGKPPRFADRVLLYPGSKVTVVRALPDGLLKVQVRHAVADTVGRSGEDERGVTPQYSGEVGYLIPGLVKGD